MVDHKSPKIVGQFLKQRREAAGISQRALGQLFTPPVTTQFISNVERGVTPLPPHHVPVLAKALNINESEFMVILEKEYTAKLANRLGHAPGEAPPEAGAPLASVAHLVVANQDFEMMKRLHDAFKQADERTRQELVSLCDRILGTK